MSKTSTGGSSDTSSVSGGTTTGGSGGPKGPKFVLFIADSIILVIILILLMHIIDLLNTRPAATTGLQYYRLLPSQGPPGNLTSADTLILFKSNTNSGTSSDTTGGPKKPA